MPGKDQHAVVATSADKNGVLVFVADNYIAVTETTDTATVGKIAVIGSKLLLERNIVNWLSKPQQQGQTDSPGCSNIDVPFL